MPAESSFAQLVDTAGIQRVNSTECYPYRHQPGDAGLPLLHVENALGHALIALQGAQLLEFQPRGQREMLWLSPKCVLKKGTPIRGGIPLCMPWFGPGPDGKSAHGFARDMEWSLVAAEILENGATLLALELEGDANTCALWPHAFAFRLEVIVGTELKLNLSVENCGTDAAPFAFVFHTYFAVPNVADARVSGLEDIRFFDKTDPRELKRQTGEVTFSAEVNSIYFDVPAKQTLHSPEGKVIVESASRCAVVWNAWNTAANIFDLGEGNHVGYVCVERGEVAERSLHLPPGEKHAAWMTLSY